MHVICLTLVLLVATVIANVAESGPAPPEIRITILIVKGSKWESDDGKAELAKQRLEASRIWRNVGLRLTLRAESITGQLEYKVSDKQLTNDLSQLADTYKPTALGIVCIATNKVLSGNENIPGFADPHLGQKNTPLCLISQRILDEGGGGHRTLAHELGHILMRDPTHHDARNNLMNWFKGVDVSDELTEDQKKKAQQYVPALASRTYTVNVNNRGTPHTATFILSVIGPTVTGESYWPPSTKNNPLVGRIDGDSITITRNCTPDWTGPCAQTYTAKRQADGSYAGTWAGTGARPAGTGVGAVTWTMTPQ